jgi:predicted AlkP superfamily pyrophosphatase or phosphodiesterase
MPSRLGAAVCALSLTLLAPACAGGQTPAPSAQRVAAPTATRVLAISVDGLNTDAIRRLGAKRAPTLHRLLTEGAGTLNARTEYEQNVTLPNHTGMMTGRRVDRTHGGHGVTWDDDRPGTTVARAAGHPVKSVFSVVHAAGAGTALFSTKEKFELYERSWPRSIDRFAVDEDQAALVRTATADLVSQGRTFTFLHVSLPDRFGHEYGGMSKQYLAAVRRTDRQLGRLLARVEARPALAEHLDIILTADHGFQAGSTTHTPRVLQNYRIPFLAWGPDVAAGDLYALNPDYRDPRTRHPSYAAKRQPVRNGDLGNLALDLLGMRAIPGSELDAGFDLDVN